MGLAQLGHRLFQAVAGLPDQGLRACQVHADEARALGAEHGSQVKPQLRVLLHQAFDAGVIQAQAPAVQPRQVRALKRHQAHSRHAVDGCLQHRVVPVEYLLELVEPFLSAFVACLGGRDAEHARLVVARAVAGAFERRAQVGVGNEDVGQLQSGQIERFAGRRAHHGVSRVGIAERGVRHVLEAGAREVGVDLVGDDGDAVAQADVADAPQLVGGPSAADGVVRVAQDEQLRARLL